MRILILTFFINCLSGLVFGQEVSTLVPTQPGVGYEAVNWSTSSGRILIPDFTFNQVHEVFLDGSRTTVIDSINQPLGGAFDQAGNFYVSEYGGPGKLIRLDQQGNTSILATNLGGPAGLLVDSSQQIIYIADYDGSVIRRYFIADGSTDTLVHGQGLNGPDAIIYAPDGNLIVNNFNDNKIFQITTDGEISLFATLSGSPNSGYLVNTGNEYIVAGFASNRIWRVDYNGNSTVWAGTAGPGNTDGPLSQATFNRPNGIAISADRDSILLSDGNNSPKIRLITNVSGMISSVLGLKGADFKLKAFPNPAKDHLNINFHISESGKVKLTVLNAEGQAITTLIDSTLQSGKQDIRWSIPADTPSGYYQCLLETGDYLSTIPILIKK